MRVRAGKAKVNYKVNPYPYIHPHSKYLNKKINRRESRREPPMEDVNGKTITRTCDNGCTESLSLTDGAPITEALAIQLGAWLTVTGETVVPEGIRIDSKYFCSTECLRDYVNQKIAEYEQAEDRVVRRMEADAPAPSMPSGIILTD